MMGKGPWEEDRRPLTVHLSNKGAHTDTGGGEDGGEDPPRGGCRMLINVGAFCTAPKNPTISMPGALPAQPGSSLHNCEVAEQGF